MHRCREIPRNCLDCVDRQDKIRQDTTVARKSLFQSMKTFLECNVLHFLEWMEDNKEKLSKPQFCGLRRMMNTDYRESRCNIDCVNLNLVDRENTTVKSFFRSTEPFSRYSVHNFLEWMGYYEKVPRKARSTEWDILFMLYNMYKTQSIFTFQLKVHPNISDHIMQNAIDSDNCTFVSDCMRTYLYDQGHFEDMMYISPRIVDIILQKVKNLMLKKLPNLTNNGIVLSLCWECGQGNRLVIVMSYKGKIELANQIPNKVLGFKFVLYNFTEPSKEACDVFKPITVSKKTHLPTVTESEARELFRKHSNLTMISASRYKSMGYSKGKHGIVEKPCINLFCSHKGYIPYGEEQFPKHIGEFEVDVLEGYSVLGSGASLEIGGHIARSGCGSIGGFVDLPNKRTGLLTCAHVIFSLEELEELESLDRVPPGIEVKAFDKTVHTYRVCGTCIAAEFPKCFQQATSPHPNVDAALIELDPVIDTFSLRTVSSDQLYSAGFDPNNPPAFTGEVVSLSEPDSFLRTHGRIPDKLDGVVKYGCETGLTIGNLYHSGAHVRFLNHDLKLPNSSRSAILCDQIEIQNLPQGQFFECGDSGSFVFCINPDKTLSCLGMAVGLSLPQKSCIVTPIDRILRSVCPPDAHLKPCSSLDQQPSRPSLDIILSAMGTLNTSLHTVEAKFQASLQNVERNMERNSQASLQNLQTEMQILQRQVQQTEDSRIHSVETNLQAQKQRKKRKIESDQCSLADEVPGPSAPKQKISGEASLEASMTEAGLSLKQENFSSDDDMPDDGELQSKKIKPWTDTSTLGVSTKPFSMVENLIKFNKNIEYLKEPGDVNYLNIEENPHLLSGSSMINIDYREIISHLDYLDCEGLHYGMPKKPSTQSIEPFHGRSVNDFLEWMNNCKNILRKTHLTQWGSISSVLFVIYAKEAMLEFKPKRLPTIIDCSMRCAIEIDNYLLAFEIVRTFLFDNVIQLQRILQSTKGTIDSVILKRILQTSRKMILRKFPILQRNNIQLSFCWDCKQKSRLVMILSYKGSIDITHRVPNEIMGFELVLYNFSQPSDEASRVFQSICVSNKTPLPTVTEDEARELFRKHSNLTMISASPYKSMGYSKGKHRTVEKLCISLFCFHKGYIPYGEEEFPKQSELWKWMSRRDIATLVLEDLYNQEDTSNGQRVKVLGVSGDL